MMTALFVSAAMCGPALWAVYNALLPAGALVWCAAVCCMFEWNFDRYNRTCQCCDEQLRRRFSP